jgi:hypothetical protein
MGMCYIELKGSHSRENKNTRGLCEDQREYYPLEKGAVEEEIWKKKGLRFTLRNSCSRPALQVAGDLTHKKIYTLQFSNF